MKPQTRRAIENRSAFQPWGRTAVPTIVEAHAAVSERLGFSLDLHFPRAGDYFLTADVDPAACEEAKGLTLVLSTRLPNAWFVLGKLFIKNGVFYRRARGVKLFLVPASNVHLTRPIRAALRDLL